MYSAHIVNKLEEILMEFDKIILLTEPYFSLGIVEGVNTDKKILMMSKEVINIENRDVGIYAISQEEEKEMINLYHTYEFSDCFKVLSDSPHSFGGVLNLYRKGLLTKEEVAKIIFY